jgi:hypothetical protein
VEPATKTEPPFVPLRHTGWATRRTPLWVFAVLVLLAGGVLAVSLSHKPSQAQRAGDLKAYFSDVNAGIESCAGGMRDSIAALHQVQAGDRADLATAIGIITLGAQNCAPINNQPLSDFTGYQVTESLARFPLDTADSDVIAWASSGAVKAQQDMLAVLRATTQDGLANANATLRLALRNMDARRGAAYAIWRSAERSTGATAPLPYLPG